MDTIWYLIPGCQCPNKNDIIWIHIRIRNKDDSLDVVTMADEEGGYCMILDTGAMVTVISYLKKTTMC